jgi:hypothetical protein
MEAICSEGTCLYENKCDISQGKNLVQLIIVFLKMKCQHVYTHCKVYREPNQENNYLFRLLFLFNIHVMYALMFNLGRSCSTHTLKTTYILFSISIVEK